MHTSCEKGTIHLQGRLSNVFKYFRGFSIRSVTIATDNYQNDKKTGCAGRWISFQVAIVELGARSRGSSSHTFHYLTLKEILLGLQTRFDALQLRGENSSS